MSTTGECRIAIIAPEGTVQLPSLIVTHASGRAALSQARPFCHDGEAITGAGMIGRPLAVLLCTLLLAIARLLGTMRRRF